MLIDQRARVIRELQRIPGIAHSQSKRGSFRGIQTSEINGHKKGRHLVVGNAAAGVGLNEGFDLVRRKGLAVALGFDECKEIHDQSTYTNSTERFAQ